MAIRLPSFSARFNLLRWNRLRWRSKSLMLAGIFCAAGFLIAVGVVTLWQLDEAPFRFWFSMTFVPFVFIVMLGVLARLHQQIDMRAGREASFDEEAEGK